MEDGSWCALAPPNLDSHMSGPGHLPFTLRKAGPLYPRPQCLRSVEYCRTSHHLPLEVLVGEPIADLEFHR
jgi:hypothetical protein